MTARSSRRALLPLLAATLAMAQRGEAQGRDSLARAAPDSAARTLACPRAGTALRAWAGGGAGGAAADTTRGPARARGVLDTVITLDIADRTWQRDSLSVGVSLGAAGRSGARGLPWHACAGATATLGRITATLHDVHGQIHLKADPRALQAIGDSARSSPPAPPRR